MYSYYHTRMPRKHSVKAKPKMATVLGAEVMWAVAAYATQVNNGYVKLTVFDDNNKIVQHRNRDIIQEEVRGGLTNLTPDHFELGRKAREWHGHRLVVKRLKGQTLSDFERTLCEAVEQEEFSNHNDALLISVVASQIVSYHNGLAQEKLEASVDHSPLAAVDAKVSVEANVVRSVYSQKYNVHFVTARTKCNRLVFFSYREALTVNTPIRVRGTVKAHRSDRTQLTRVRLV